MSHLISKKLLIIVLFLILPKILYGQPHESSSEAGIIIFLKDVDSLYGNDFTLENGRIYYFRHLNSVGHPFLYKDYQKGEIQIGSKKYLSKKIIYDINTEQLVYLKNYNLPIIINNRNLKYFTLLEDTFINFTNKGIFQQIYDSDRFQVLIKWKKRYSKVVYGNKIGKYSNAERDLFIYRKGVFKVINSKKDIIELFNNEEKMKPFLRKNKLKPRSSKKQELIIFFRKLDLIMQ